LEGSLSNEIKAILEEMGLFLGMKLDDFPAPYGPLMRKKKQKKKRGKRRKK